MSVILNEESFKNARLTQILLILNIICFILFNVIFSDSVLYYIIQYNAAIWEGEVWRLFTAMFLHSGVLHLASNMMALLFYGVAAEQYYTRFQYLAIYLGSGLLGSFFTLLFNSPETYALGASGAIFGLIGAVFYVIIRSDSRYVLIGIIYMAFFLQNSFAPGIGTWAHIFGLLGGLLSAYLIQRSRTRNRIPRNSRNLAWNSQSAPDRRNKFQKSSRFYRDLDHDFQ